jgi:uncharacterized membrane protein
MSDSSANRRSNSHNHDEPKRRRPISVNEFTERNIALIGELEAADYARRTPLDRFVDGITGFCGRIVFVWVHAAWFVTWIALNELRIVRFDRFPFSLLTLIVSLEVIFLSTFILISQNRQGKLNERRNHLDLQINLLSEQENTKMLTMLAAIEHHLGIGARLENGEPLMEDTHPEEMLRQIDEAMEREESKDSNPERPETA